MPDLLEEFARETIDRLLKELPAEKLLERLTPEERLKGLSVEELLKGLPRETLEALLERMRANGSATDT
jgi:hypothetical protein